MADDLRKMYRTVMEDHFPEEMRISFGGHELRYRKRTWTFPEKGELIEKGLRYGENPGQEAALFELVSGALSLGECRFIEPGRGLVSATREADMLQAGKHPGKTNLTDLDNGLNILKFLMDRPAAVILKHNNPCGAAHGASVAEAYARAFRADRIAAFGGCAVLNRPVDRAAAELLAQTYLEVVAAPDFEEGALPVLARRPNLRVIAVPRMDRLSEWVPLRFLDFKSLMDGGIIVQQSYLSRIRSAADFTPAEAAHDGKIYRVERPATEPELRDALFGWFIELGVTSNSVLFVKDECTVGIGTGEQDRVGVAEIAAMKARRNLAEALAHERFGMGVAALEAAAAEGARPREDLETLRRDVAEAHGGLTGATMISDAFFPFRDGVDVGLRHGVTCVVQPGGGLRDFESIEACNEHHATMLFTGQRAFKH